MTESRNIILHYPRNLTDKPIISTLVKKFDLTINISRARIEEDEEGIMVIEISGKRKNLQGALNYLDELGVTYKPISKVIKRVEEKCTHCSACIVICPTGALTITDRNSMEVVFIQDKCVACGLCIPACPYRAMEMFE